MLRILMSYAKINKLSNIHPIEKVVLFLFPIIVCGFVKNSTVILLINMVTMIGIHVILKNPKTIILKFTKGILIFSIFTSISMIFDQSLKYITILVLKSISGSLSILLFTMTTPIEDIFYLGSRYSWLRDICDIAKNMIRFLILIEDEYLLLKNAMKSRQGFNTIKSKVINNAKIMGLLFVNTMRRWKEISDSIESRGYRGHTVYSERKFDFSITRFSLGLAYNIILTILILTTDKL